MLKSLTIKNIALINELSADFTDGLNIITGETGAGKSIIIDSIGLVLGERAERELLRTGAQKGGAEAVFSVEGNKKVLSLLDEAGIEPDDGNIVISREISVSKTDSQTLKSVCRINGTMISLAELKEITSRMVDVHGQHEHQTLISQSTHIGFLDDYANKETAPLKERCKELCKEYHATEKSMHTGFVSEQEREQKIDILTYQLNEIDSVSPEVGEDDALEKEIEILSNGERIMQALYNASSLLSDGEQGALTLSKSACNELYPITSFSDEYRQLADTVSEAYYNLEAAADSVKRAAELFSFDAQRLDEAENRLSAISKLKRKYGNSIEAVLEFADKARNELDALQNSEKHRAELAAKLIKLKSEYNTTAAELTNVRKKAAERFCKEVTDNLCDLGLKKSVFEVYICDLDGEVPSESGKDYVEFLFSANPGEPKKALRKVASGGEMSRIMLGIKNVLSDIDCVDTMIFDEIDTGISGSAATVVGQKMQSIAKKKQILAITHLPQIAAFADTHFLVEKTQTDDATSSDLRQLEGEKRISEVARIMGGAESETAKQHAKELIEAARKQGNKATGQQGNREG